MRQQYIIEKPIDNFQACHIMIWTLQFLVILNVS